MAIFGNRTIEIDQLLPQEKDPKLLLIKRPCCPHSLLLCASVTHLFLPFCKNHTMIMTKCFLMCLSFPGLFYGACDQKNLNNYRRLCSDLCPSCALLFFISSHLFWLMIADDTPGTCRSMSLVIIGTQGKSKSSGQKNNLPSGITIKSMHSVYAG